MTVPNWSATPALNVLDSGVAGSGGTIALDGTVMKPSEVDNAMRSFMAQIASWTTGTTFTGTTTVATLVVATNANPDANDGAGLGTGALGWSDLFLASGGVINWNNGDVTVTHSSDKLTIAGGVLQVGATAGVSGANIQSIVAGNSLEWGHTNPAGYRSTLGAIGGGAPFLAFNAEVEATLNTFTTRGFKGAVLISDQAGGFKWQTVATASGTVQTPTDILTLTTAGLLTPLSLTVSSGAVALSPANANVVLSPTGTGVVTINPATLGTMNKVTIGGTTPAAATVTTLAITEGAVISGSYTPTITSILNVAASTPRTTYYTRVGANVTVFGQVDIDPTATSATAFRMSLPVASNFTAITQAAGSMTLDLFIPGLISSLVATDDIRFDYTPTDAANRTVYFMFGYVIA